MAVTVVAEEGSTAAISLLAGVPAPDCCGSAVNVPTATPDGSPEGQLLVQALLHRNARPMTHRQPVQSNMGAS